jgi:hypothetical protein
MYAKKFDGGFINMSAKAVNVKKKMPPCAEKNLTPLC